MSFIVLAVLCVSTWAKGSQSLDLKPWINIDGEEYYRIDQYTFHILDSNLQKAYWSMFNDEMNEFERRDTEKALDSLHKSHLAQLKGKKFIIKVNMKLSKYDFKTQSFTLQHKISEDNRHMKEMSDMFDSKKRKKKHRDVYFGGNSMGSDERWVTLYNKRPSKGFKKALKSKNLFLKLKDPNEDHAREVAEWRSFKNYHELTEEQVAHRGYYITGTLKKGRMRILGFNKVVLVPEEIFIFDHNQKALVIINYPK